MNIWTQRSVDLANSPGYLDKLSEIYTMQDNPERPMPEHIKNQIRHAYNQRNIRELVSLLINNAPVFPVKDSYIGFFRKNPNAIDENPITLERIANRLYSLGFDKMIEEASRPKETNRQLGSVFKNWSQSTLGFQTLDKNRFLAARDGIFILRGSDIELKKFANNNLNCNLNKGIDIVIKIDQEYIIGEAKFLTTPGGEQDRGFDDAHSFISNRNGNAKRIAILDGYIWLRSISGLHDRITQYDEEEVILSSLLLKDFILSRRQ